MASQTIFALASAAGRAAVAVIRVSGPQCRFVLETIIGRIPEPRLATFTTLHDSASDVLDQGLVLWFPGPRSFTGEDCAEFQIHGSRASIAAVLKALSALPGCRLAEPGEFSRRAFLNGKLDLAQAEGLADLIDAETDGQRRQALRQLDGVLGEQTQRWRQELLQLQALVEADIDFSDEADVGTHSHAKLKDSVEKLITEIDNVFDGFKYSDHIRQGVYVVISGAPNVGKSSLLNTIVKREAAIVSSEAGTTRDIVEISLQFHEYLVTFADTAGIRETDQEIERLGIERARHAARKADLILWLSDGVTPFGSEQFSAPVLRVQTKFDLGRPLLEGFDFAISTQTGFGLDQLYSRIRDYLASFPTGSGLVTRERHYSALIGCREALVRVICAPQDISPEFIAEDLRRAAYELGRIVGQHGVEDVLASLFSTFCIGK